MSVNEQVREAIARIEPLPGNGPNRFTVDVKGWALSAPTRPALAAMLWDWFTNEATKERFGMIDELMDRFGARCGVEWSENGQG
jgi:hypothetical protein